MVCPQPGCGVPVGAAVLPRHRDVGRHERADLSRRDDRHPAALGPRCGGACHRARAGHGVAADLHHDGRLPVQSAPRRARPVEPAGAARRGCGDAGGAGRPAQAADRTRLCRGLRHVRDPGCDAHQSGAPAEGSVPGHSGLRRRRTHHRSAVAAGGAGRRNRRDRRLRAPGDARLLEQSVGRRRRVHRARWPAFPAHRRSGAHRRRRLLLHGRPAEADDQCIRLQGLAGRGRGDDVPPSGGPGGVRRSPPATRGVARPSRPWSCCDRNRSDGSASRI